ncbi:MAG: cytochrome d ubiquinol oxidase subunit II [Caldilineaceae bacterium]|nr:cytochrome d ubiquinol oxidase subunit II [Caldilineaceae bacterium]
MLTDIPILFVLLGLIAYNILAGADFGAGFWTLFAGGGQASVAETRAHARHTMGPVWEANHVWLIFVLVVCWTAYPVAYASIVSTLAVPLLIAAVGIIMRGTSYALSGQLTGARVQQIDERVFALSSILTPFAFGTVAGAIASGRVPVGNAAGDLMTSWLNPASIVIGLLAVANSSYLAAVYLAADAHRRGEQALAHDFRWRALGAGVVTGGLAMASLGIMYMDARPIWAGLTSGWGLVMLSASAVAGITTLFLVWNNRFGPARVAAAAAVAVIVMGWGVAQQPTFLPGLTVSQAAADRTTLVAVIVAIAIGAVILLPSLVLLFRLFLHGRLDGGTAPPVVAVVARERGNTESRRRLLSYGAGACLFVGVGLMVATSPGPLYIVAIACMIGFAACAFLLAMNPDYH